MTTIKSKPLISVVMPVYNVEQYVEQAILSVLSQSYDHLELIVVNDQSTDNSMLLIRAINDPRIRIVEQTNRGLAGARNTGIREAKGDFIALLDSDDFWHTNKLQLHIELMLTNPKCGVSFCASQFVNEHGENLKRIQAPQNKIKFDAGTIFCRNPIGNGSVPIIHKSIFEKIAFQTSDKDYAQYFDESLRQSEDIECWTRIALQTKTQFCYIDQCLTYYRLNNSGLSADTDKQLASWQTVLNKIATHSPAFTEHYGSLAKAFQYRYLARRCISQGHAKKALSLMISAISSNKKILSQEPKRSLETLITSLILSLFPKRLQITITRYLLN